VRRAVLDPFFVIPAEAGIQGNQRALATLDRLSPGDGLENAVGPNAIGLPHDGGVTLIQMVLVCRYWSSASAPLSRASDPDLR
jgi:hypothetical protein